MSEKRLKIVLDTNIFLASLASEHSYSWNLLKDADDNKFVDCTVSASADFIVSNDKGFNVLKSIPFPPIVVLKYADFETNYKAILT